MFSGHIALMVPKKKRSGNTGGQESPEGSPLVGENWLHSEKIESEKKTFVLKHEKKKNNRKRELHYLAIRGRA